VPAAGNDGQAEVAGIADALRFVNQDSRNAAIKASSDTA
jgi:hypothetical protein